MTEQLILIIKITKERSGYTAKGDMTVGIIKLAIGEMEHIKSRLLFDLEKTLDDGYSIKEA